MKKLKLFPKTFLYVVSLMLVISFISHALIYFFTPLFYTMQKRSTIKRDTDSLVEILSLLPEEEYKENILEFMKGSDMTVMLSAEKRNEKDVWRIFSNDPDENETEEVYFSNSDQDGISIRGATSLNDLVVDRTFTNMQDDTYKLKTHLPLEPVREASDVVMTLLPVTLFICILVSAIFAFIYSKQITKPILEISSVARQMGLLEREAVCSVTSGDEIGTLANDLNHLYENLLTTIDRLQDEISKVSESEQLKVDFLRTASHELKTPVTAVSGMLEGMIHNVGRYQDRDLYLQECKKQMDGLGELLREVLDSSDLDMYAEIRETREVELGSVMDGVIEPYGLIAKAKNVTLVFEKDGSFSAELPEKLFSKAVSNVVSNAVNYTDEGKSVHIYFKDRNVVIENECIPLHEDVLAHLSEPFYRPDFDHNHDSGGNGLGLYIADKALAACGVAYSFQSTEDKKGMRFTIQL